MRSSAVPGSVWCLKLASCNLATLAGDVVADQSKILIYKRCAPSTATHTFATLFKTEAGNQVFWHILRGSNPRHNLSPRDADKRMENPASWDIMTVFAISYPDMTPIDNHRTSDARVELGHLLVELSEILDSPNGPEITARE